MRAATVSLCARCALQRSLRRPAARPTADDVAERRGRGPRRARTRCSESVRNRGRASYQCAMTEFDDVIRLLEDGRPQATDLELDEIKQRVRRRAADPSRRSQSMKSRLAILAMLAMGMLFSTAGVGLALSGGNASVSQYAECTPTSTGTTPPSGTGGTTQPGTVGAQECEEGGVLPAEQSHPKPPATGG